MWSATGLLLILSFFLKKAETKKAIKKAKAMMGMMMPQILAILLAIGLVLGIIPPSLIEKVLGQGQTFISVIIASAFGSITIIPGFVAFPLVGSLVDQGADYSVAAAFITTLTMVGIATISLESKQFGNKFTLYRNGLSFLGAIVIAILLGMVM
jgi:uncharacterized membrane protein YraQ (UPF0718 family)